MYSSIIITLMLSLLNFNSCDESAVRSLLKREESLGYNEDQLKEKAKKDKTIANLLTYYKEVTNQDGGTKRLLMWGTKLCGEAYQGTTNSVSVEGIDKCCMRHDKCPLQVNDNKSRWGVYNTLGYLLNDCKCDNAFHACLKKKSKVSDDVAAYTIGNLYFNKMATKCLRFYEDVDPNEQQVTITEVPIKSKNTEPIDSTSNAANLKGVHFLAKEKSKTAQLEKKQVNNTTTSNETKTIKAVIIDATKF